MRSLFLVSLAAWRRATLHTAIGVGLSAALNAAEGTAASAVTGS